MDWPEWSATNITERPGVRVNQLGYLTGRPKEATLISDAEEPIHFTVRNRNGAAVHTVSQPWSVRPEPTSGLRVHVLDFTARHAWSRLPDRGRRSVQSPLRGDKQPLRHVGSGRVALLLPMRSGPRSWTRSCRAMDGQQGTSGGRRIAAIWRCPRGPGPKRSSCTRGGGAMARSTCRAAGMTRATTASTSPAAPLRYGSCSARSIC